MRRRLSLFLILLGILALGVRFFVDQEPAADHPPGMEIRFAEYMPLSPGTRSLSLANQLQSLVDQTSEAAMNGNWTTASQTVQQLDDVWQSILPNQIDATSTKEEIDAAIQTLYFNVWGRDEQGVLTTAQKLTVLISRLEM